MFGKKNKIISDRERRIQELEEIFCPFNQHDWIILDEYIVPDLSTPTVCDNYGERILQCKRCKKIIHDNNVCGRNFKYKVESK